MLKLAALALLALPTLAHAQTMNKCTDAAGKVVYQSTPCASSGTAVKNWDKQTREQQLEAKQGTTRRTRT